MSRAGAVRAEGLGMNRGGRAVLDGVELSVEPGTLLAVTGSSGAGKSTLLWALAGLLEPTRGTVVRTGAPVGVVLQEFGLVSVLTAMENVAMPLQLTGRSGTEVSAAATAALERAGLGPAELGADRLVGELSGGQLQRVAVARALIVEPAVLIADEPTSELDATNRDVVVAALQACARAGAAVVLATHDPDVAATCDRRLHLTDGRADCR